MSVVNANGIVRGRFCVRESAIEYPLSGPQRRLQARPQHLKIDPFAAASAFCDREEPAVRRKSFRARPTVVQIREILFRRGLRHLARPCSTPHAVAGEQQSPVALGVVDREDAERWRGAFPGRRRRRAQELAVAADTCSGEPDLLAAGRPAETPHAAPVRGAHDRLAAAIDRHDVTVVADGARTGPNAMRSPPGEQRRWPIQPAVLKITLPIGYSS